MLSTSFSFNPDKDMPAWPPASLNLSTHAGAADGVERADSEDGVRPTSPAPSSQDEERPEPRATRPRKPRAGNAVPRGGRDGAAWPGTQLRSRKGKLPTFYENDNRWAKKGDYLAVTDAVIDVGVICRDEVVPAAKKSAEAMVELVQLASTSLSTALDHVTLGLEELGDPAFLEQMRRINRAAIRIIELRRAAAERAARRAAAERAARPS